MNREEIRRRLEEQMASSGNRPTGEQILLEEVLRKGGPSVPMESIRRLAEALFEVRLKAGGIAYGQKNR